MQNIYNPAVIATLFSLGMMILIFFVIPGKQRTVIHSFAKNVNFREKAARALKEAGIFDKSPGIIMISLVAITAIIALVSFQLIGWAGIVLAVIVVPVGFQIFLIYKQRQFMGRAQEELIPFLNRISTFISAGIPVENAYMNAVEEADTLKEILEDSAAKISSGENFTEALLETLEFFPIRMWAVFIRQVELYEELGGDAESTLRATIVQVNQMIQLQAEAKSDTAAMIVQQRIIIIILIAGLFGLGMFAGREFLTILVTTVVGLVGLIVGLVIIIFGLRGASKTIRMIERKISI